MDIAMDIVKILFEKDMDSQSNLSSLMTMLMAML